MTVRMQVLDLNEPKRRIVNGKTVYSRAVQIISLDQFLRRARILSGRSMSHRELLQALLNHPLVHAFEEED